MRGRTVPGPYHRNLLRLDPEARRARLQEAFDWADADAAGELDSSGLARALGKLGIEVGGSCRVQAPADAAEGRKSWALGEGRDSRESSGRDGV